MVTIVKGNEKIVCSRGTYEDQYRQLGYRIASEKNKETTEKVVSPIKEEAEKEEDKITAKYGVRRKTTSKKEEE